VTHGSNYRVLQIDHVELFVPERCAAAEWYSRTLGFEIVKDCEAWAADPRGPLMISTDGGSTMLALFEGEPQGTQQVVGLRRVAFRVDGEAFLEFLDRLERVPVHDHDGTVVKVEDVKDHDRAWSIYFCDPYGTRLEITSYDYDAIAGRLTR
jgi:catechol 2,3-dioxygenase-like lactoylglutathione lyase family enzyme